MTIEFIVAHAGNDSSESCAAVREALVQAFKTEGLDNDQVEIEQMIVPHNWRDEVEVKDKDTQASQRCILGFSLELPDHLTGSADLVAGFIDALRAAPLTAHVVRFEDPSLFTQLQKWSKEIFELEMKLRRVLTTIYLAAPFSGNPYDLLHEEVVNTQATSDQKQMEEAVENEFFHLLFSNYPALNSRPPIKIDTLLKVIETADDFGTLRVELKRTPAEQEDDLGLLASIKQYSKPIEDMRNCVAHYRRPSQKKIGHYNNAKGQLESILNDFLARLQITEE